MYETIRVEGEISCQKLFRRAIESIPQIFYPLITAEGRHLCEAPYSSVIDFNRGEIKQMQVRTGGGKEFRNFVCKIPSLLDAGYTIEKGFLRLVPYSDKASISLNRLSEGRGDVILLWSGLWDADPDERIPAYWGDLEKEFKNV